MKSGLRRSKIACLLSIVGFFVPLLGTEVDNKVKEQLDTWGYEYTIDSDNDFKILYKLDNGRTQLCFVNSNTETFGLFEIREVWSPVYKSEAQLPAWLANKLLEESYKKKLGAYEVWVKSGSDTRLAIFCAKIDATCSGSDLDDAIKAVSLTADLMEKELSGDKDEF